MNCLEMASTVVKSDLCVGAHFCLSKSAISSLLFSLMYTLSFGLNNQKQEEKLKMMWQKDFENPHVPSVSKHSN